MIDQQGAEVEDSLVFASFGNALGQFDPSYQDLHPGRQFTQTEGLGHVIVATELKAEHFVGFFATGGEHKDRRDAVLGPDLAQDIHA